MVLLMMLSLSLRCPILAPMDTGEVEAYKHRLLGDSTIYCSATIYCSDICDARNTTSQ
jgi:hypothetical protein